VDHPESAHRERLRLALVFGGRSGEHEVSVVSARSVAGALDPDRYEVVPMAIDRSGRWADADDARTVLATSGDRTDRVEAFSGRDGIDSRLLDGSVDLAFPVLHGPYGEDGTIQGLFEMLGVPYVGCDHAASAVATFEMDHGLIYTYRGSWCAEGLNTSWEASWHAIGTKGSLHWDGGEEIRVEVARKTGGFLSESEDLQVPAWEGKDQHWNHAGVMREFLQCVREGGSPETRSSDNIKSLAMVFRAIESAKAGRSLEISP